VCGGVRAENVTEIVRSTGAEQFHSAMRQEVGSRARHRSPSLRLGASKIDDYARQVVVAEDVKKLRMVMDALEMKENTSIGNK
jgi:copper homeostasis protein CutC